VFYDEITDSAVIPDNNNANNKGVNLRWGNEKKGKKKVASKRRSYHKNNAARLEGKRCTNHTESPM